IKSEIELISSAALAREVVAQLGLRLTVSDPSVRRTSLISNTWVAAELPDNTYYALQYDHDGGSAALLSADGQTLGTAEIGEQLDGGDVRITPLENPGDADRYVLYVAPTETALPQVRDYIGASSREGTNLIDLRFASTDSALAIPIANAGAEVLREMGARKVRDVAARDVQFVQQQLDSARTQLNRALNNIRTFKESEQFTSLSFEEQELVNEGHRLSDDVVRYEWHLAVFSALIHGMEQSGAESVDLVRFLAELPADANPEIRMGATRIQEKANELDRVLTIDLKTRAHPAAAALISQIDLLEGELVASVRASIGVTEQKLTTAAGQLAAIRARQRAFPTLANELQTLEMQRELDQNSYQFLLSQLYQARIVEAAAGPYVHIVDAAQAAPRLPQGTRGFLVLGAVLGLFLGIGSSLFLEYLDRTIRTRSEAEGLLGLPVLGTIPGLNRRSPIPMPPGTEPAQPRMVVRDPFDRAGEAFRNLRLNLTFVRINERPVRSILVTSPGPEEGKSTTSLNLATTLAQYGERVLLIDADLRRPVLHRVLERDREPGLTNLLIGNAGPEDVIQRDAIPNLDLIAAGPCPPNPAELVGSLTMGEMLGKLENDYDRVIVDSPPVLAVTDAAGTAAYVDGVLLVVRSGRTEDRAAERATEQLNRLGVRVLGLALNDIQPRVHEENYYLRYQARYHSGPPGSGSDLTHRLRGALTKVRLL
ncbi:MAG: polysaccharide biosynthesis tyrosine autokinase, partial [Longimicrobiales bacterium]